VKVNGAISELVDSGLFTIATNSWLSGDLAQIAAREGIVVKTYYVVKRTPAWAKRRLYLRGLRSNQREVIARFIEKVAEGVERKEIGKKKPASIYIKKTFKGTKVGTTEKPKRTPEQLRELANEIRRMKPARAQVMAAAATAAAGGVEREVE
jgi:hypothetical protein